jgi:hypothetical protein
MLNGKYVSVETIIAGAYRDLGLSDQINFEDAVEWIGECMELISVNMQYIDKVEYIRVTNFRAKLPCDLLYLTSVNGAPGCVEDEDCLGDVDYSPMRYSTDTFHHRYCSSLKNSGNCSLTYKINDDFVFPSFEEGAIAIAYSAMPTDERGFPMIPEDVKFRRAATDYLKWKLGFLEWSKGKMISQVYNALEVEKLYSMGAAQNRGNMPSIDKMESIKNNWLRLIPKINDHSSNFRNTGNPEHRVLHNISGKNLRTGREGNTETYSHNS